MAAARPRWIGALKVLLPLVALGLLAAVFLFPHGRSLPRGVDVGDLDFSLSDGLRLSNPRFSGETDAGRPFTLRSDWALPDGPNPDLVALGPLVGEMSLEGGRSLTLEAGAGEIATRRSLLTLTESVAVETSDGYRLTASAATVDMKQATVEAQGPVHGAGPLGEITAASMRAARRDDGDYIWFEGGVRVVVTPAPGG